MMIKKELMLKAKALKPVINIGKNGLTEEQIRHIGRILKKKKILKIKINRAALEERDKEEIIAEILEKTSSELVSFVGFNAVIWKK